MRSLSPRAIVTLIASSELGVPMVCLLRPRLAVAFVVTVTAPVHSQTLFTSGLTDWNVSDAVWATGSGGPYDQIWAEGAAAVFEGAGGPVSIASDGARAAAGLTFATDGVRLLGPGSLLLTSVNTVQVDAGFTGVISNAFSSAIGLHKTGAGTLELASSGIVVPGLVDLADGTLRLRDALAFQGAITNRGQALEMSGVTVNAWTYTNRVTGSGTWTLIGSGVTNQSAWGFGGDHRGFTGDLILDRARFEAKGVSALPSGRIEVRPGGTLLLNGAGVFTNTLHLAGTGWLEPAFAGGIGALRLISGVEQAGPVVLTDHARVGSQGSESGLLSGPISGPFNLRKGGTGAITLGGTAPNVYGGLTHVEGGTLILAKPDGVNAVPGDVRIGDGSGGDVLQLGAHEQIPDTATVHFASLPSQWGYFKLMGRTETVAAIQDTSGSGVIENVESEASPPGDGRLILAGPGDSFFNGYVRNRAGGTSTNLLHLAQNGPGTLTLAGGGVTYTGNTQLNAGALVLQNTTGFTSPIQNNGRPLTFLRTTTGSQNYARSITGSGPLWVLGNGVVGVGDVTFSATNTAFNADTTVENARLIVSNPNFLPTGLRVAQNHGQFWLGGTNQTYPLDFTLSGTGWKEGTYPTGLGALRISGGAKLTGTVTLAGPTRVGNHGSETGVFNASVTGNHALEKFGTGVMYVDAATGHTGPLQVSGGYWVARHPEALGTPAGETQVMPGATLQLELPTTNETSVVVSDETVILQGLGVGNTRGALATWTGANVWNGPVVLNSPTNGVFAQSGSLNLAGAVSEVGGARILRKQGGATLIFSGSAINTWSGGFQVQAGVVRLAKAPGAYAVPALVQMGVGDTNQPHLHFDAEEQLPPGTVLTGENPWGAWTRFNLNGFDVTLAGISNATGSLVIQNEGIPSTGATPNPPPATLTLSNATEQVFGGYLRDRDSGASPTTLALTKRGVGRLTFQRPPGQTARIYYTGTTRLEEGTLRLVDLGAGNVFDSPLELFPGTTLEIHSTQPLAGKWLYSRPLTGAGRIVKTGPGVFGLTNVLSPSGEIEIQEGRLMSDNNNANWSGCTAQVTVWPGAEFDLRADPVTLGSLNGAGTVTNSYGGGGTDLLTLGAGDHSGAFSGILRATGDGGGGENRGRVALRKTGLGTQAFSGGVQIHGPVTVAGGTLRLSGWASHPLTDTEVLATGIYHLDGGTLTNATFRIRPDGLLHGCGTLVGHLANEGTVALDCPGSDLHVSGDFTNDGRVRLIHGNTLTVDGVFTNNGILDLITGDPTLPPNFVNNGVVLYRDSVQAIEAQEGGGAFQVSVDSQPGHHYQLLRANAPAGPWEEIGPARPGDGSRMVFIDPDPEPEPRRYYQFKVDP
jgi:autotransporter-associated beta strand protein